jgi:protein-ribulosamine 3-kinase
MRLPDALAEAVQRRFGPVGAVTRVAGGSICEAARIELEGDSIFVKHAANAPAGLFASEAHGLSRLRDLVGEDLEIPAVLHVSDPASDDLDPASDVGAPRWIALEWLDAEGMTGGVRAERFGRGLARLHRAGGDGWGDSRDGFIGSLEQENAPCAEWSTFWVERRLRPRLAAVRGTPIGSDREWETLFEALPEALAIAGSEGPSPLHGDLWSGNVLGLTGGGVALVDPAFYQGHREVDLAMSELFGGLPARTLSAYEEVWPLEDGYREVRRGVYQLYYLLVHVDLFGGGYAARTGDVLRRVLSGL